MNAKPSTGTGPNRSQHGTPPADDPIVAGLRRLWARDVADPVPDDMMDLIRRIDALRQPAADAGDQ